MSSLPEEISIEKEHIEKTLAVMQEAINRKDKTYVELSAIGSCLHHCYSGMENILKRILKSRKEPLPATASSHKDLLDKAVSSGVISEDLLNRLDKFRGFRHFFVHAYGIMLDEEELMPLAKEMPDVWKAFLSEIETMMK